MAAAGFAVIGVAVAIAFPLFGGALHPGYDHARQFISGLGASGAPNASLVNDYGILPAGVLLTLFPLLAWQARRWATRVVYHSSVGWVASPRSLGLRHCHRISSSLVFLSGSSREACLPGSSRAASIWVSRLVRHPALEQLDCCHGQLP